MRMNYVSPANVTSIYCNLRVRKKTNIFQVRLLPVSVHTYSSHPRMWYLNFVKFVGKIANIIWLSAIRLQCVTEQREENERKVYYIDHHVIWYDSYRSPWWINSSVHYSTFARTFLFCFGKMKRKFKLRNDWEVWPFFMHPLKHVFHEVL